MKVNQYCGLFQRLCFLVGAEGECGGSAKSRSDLRGCPAPLNSIRGRSRLHPPAPEKDDSSESSFLVLFALGEFYCYAVILCFAQCYSLRELIANKIKLKLQVSISLSRSENITLPSGRITLFFSGNPLLSFVPTNLKPPTNPTDQ